MAGARKPAALPAIEAFQRAINVRPRALRQGQSPAGSIISVWSTGQLGEYEIPPMREPMIGLHTGGVPRFQTRLGGRWSEPSLPGQLYWIPADLPTVWRVNGRLEFVAVHFGNAALHRIASHSGLSAADAARMPFRPGFHDNFASAACTMLAEACGATREQSRFAELLADTLGVYLLQQDQNRLDKGRADGLMREVLVRTLERMQASIASGVSVEELAGLAGMSPSRFARAFKATLGVSPHQYLIARRIEMARHLLERTSFSLADIALQTGFSNQAHFTQTFREHTSLTPREFRRK